VRQLPRGLLGHYVDLKAPRAQLQVGDARRHHPRRQILKNTRTRTAADVLRDRAVFVICL
jgi:hypothetical protein